MWFMIGIISGGGIIVALIGKKIVKTIKDKFLNGW